MVATGAVRDEIASGAPICVGGPEYVSGVRILEPVVALITRKIGLVISSSDHINHIQVGMQVDPPLVCRRRQLMSRMEHHEQDNEQIVTRSAPYASAARRTRLGRACGDCTNRAVFNLRV